MRFVEIDLLGICQYGNSRSVCGARRSRAVAVFEEMARLGQAVCLTHHYHLRAVAERTVPGVDTHTPAT